MQIEEFNRRVKDNKERAVRNYFYIHHTYPCDMHDIRISESEMRKIVKDGRIRVSHVECENRYFHTFTAHF